MFKSKVTWLSLCAALFLGAASVGLAEEAKAGGHGAGGKTFGDIWHEGGWVMYALAGASIFMVGLTSEGFVRLRVTNLCPPPMVAKAKELLAAGDYQGLWNQCNATPSYFSNVMKAAMERLGRGKEAMEGFLHEVSVREASLMKTRVSYLSVIGVVTPMIGLTGTVVGMIKAFAVLGSSGIADPGALSAKISEVLIATAGGLIVAIPGFIFYYILKNRALAVVIEADGLINRLVDEIPVEELSGIRIGEAFSAGGENTASDAANTVSRSLSTSCPVCNNPVTPGENPCPHCGATLQWAD